MHEMGLAASVFDIVRQYVNEERAPQVRPVYAGAYAFDTPLLLDSLTHLRPANAQGEYYLTDTIGDLLTRGEVVISFTTDDPDEAQGINSQEQLDMAEQRFRHRAVSR